MIMHRMILLVVGLLGFAGVGSAQITQLGQCNTINLMQNFVLNSFMNTWYEIGKSSAQNADCSNLVFTTNPDGSISVSNPSVVNNFPSTTTATGTHTTGTAQFILTWAGSTTPSNFGILASDNDNFAIAINCVDISETQRTMNVWQLGRTVNSYDTPAVLNLANTALATISLTVADLTPIDHSTAACTQLPVIGAGQPVILDGQCNNAAINVVPNFDVASFTGTWHEISSYYSANAVGSCSRADYTLVGTTVNVVNSQVVNQRLDTISGTATLIGTDGSGRLSVTLDVFGIAINQELLILDTDYTGWAVSYSCVNVSPTQRQVNAWILSRDKLLSAASQPEVNRVIASMVDLNSAYFQNADQSDTGCFYFPVHQAGVPVVYPGTCEDTIAAVPNFNLAQFTGTWHEVEAYPKEQQTGTCVNHAFTTGIGNSLNLVSNQVVNQEATTATGSVILVSTDGSGRLTLTLSAGGQTLSFSYWILATDYTNYALAYSCEQLTTGATATRAVHSWKLSRQQTLSAAANTAINTAMNAVTVLDQQYFESVDQSDNGCFYYPAAVAGTPVVFPGLCDTTIPVQANFDPAAYMGLWHDVSSYPSTFQTGTCNNAYYTLAGGIVEVFNTQVINQQLDTINGTAIIPDANEPAKLLVSFPIIGTDQTASLEYWVLSTDYTSYSIVYSCTNVPNTNERMVFSWKLSREKTLSNAANTAIDQVIAPIQVLDSRYYVDQDQSATGCFYFPEATGERVVFPGLCDDTIAAVPNFNLAQFTGTWHEVEAYPKEQQTGTCVNHAFTTGIGNSLNLVSNQVVNQEATTATGSVILVSTDGSGRLTLTLSAGGQTLSFSYWILATDYTNYALAYSCEQLTTGATATRAVHSWKLSRQQTLSAAANTAINTAMNAVTVLDQQYFESVDQSDNGCFYYPAAVAGTPVVFPGLCDTTIPVQANFDPAAYMGLWHDVSSYPSTFQMGTCNNAYYTLAGGIVEVFNTQVINQQLDTINGTAIIPDANEPAKLLVSFPIAGTDQTTNSEYWVLSTDYTSYSIVYSCTNVPNTNQRIVFSWKLSREKTLSNAANAAIDQVIAPIQVLDSRYYVDQDQSATGCFYYPEATGERVVFPGLCDDTIAAVPNFNLAQFTGTWHEVEAYPKEQQTGTCVNHAFTTGIGNSLNLVSNQVVNQEATTATGSVILVSTDGTGRLTLTLSAGGQTLSFPYWILATDYTNYALAYSCEQLTTGATATRAVHSWKLSRQQTLSAAANTAINTAMNAVTVLDQQYFESVDQSDNGCFYYPAAVAGTPVVFPGLCDTTIPVQANFDPAAYMGLWHDVSSYPSTFQMGTCNNAYYTLAGGIVEVFNTQVINQQLDTINGTAIIPDANEPAKLLVSFPIAGTNQTATSEYWVLSTDYTSHSLVYSCTNLPNTNERIVFSWKLSREKTLSNAANAAIDQVIAPIQVLDSRYYVDQDQSATGCFYFPEATGERVVFPGLCDDTIAAVPNFNLAQFTGIWHEVQAYPKEQQTGSCVNHAFSTGAGNTLNLVSNQVVDQEAISATGSVTLVSTDGSGRLSLTLTTGGTTINMPYWILSTDYTSHALAYSCVQLNQDFRAVYSWKLSRQQTLSEAANTAINTVMATVPVLNQQYFENIDQSEAGCLPYPEIPAGNPIILQGQCGTVTPVANFQSAQFTGTWHEIARYASARQSGNCAANQFTSAAQNNFTLTQTIVYNERLTTVSGTATLANDGSGTMTATLSDGADLSYTTTIYILDTDYTEYALLYSCEDLPGTNNRQIYSWQLSRSQTGFSQAANERISQVIANTGDLLERYYQSTGQTNADCFYYPVFEGTPEAIVLPGTCPVVSGVPNFNPTNYLGDWYDVARYPVASQFGTCPRAHYSFVDGVITIRNAMVVDEALREQHAIARLSATGNGLLQVTMVMENGEEHVLPHYILATDYTSYSLLYACRNIGDGTSQVYTWKLSRTPTLTPDANADINNIISSTQGLLEEYYQPQSHTDQDCFYVPELVPGQSVLFPGSCAQVTPMAGFVPAQYLGWWHEYQRYPSDTYPGECTSAEFLQAGNVINVVETGVNNGVANQTTGTATISADGIITITGDGESRQWIVIITDYNTYSLLYSCEDVTTSAGPYRRVWSAKHSKADSLSVIAQNAMAPFILANPVLHDHLYETVNQSTSACFHHREDANEQVILRGLCDTNIPVQENFDSSQFAGTWYHIERYPYKGDSDGTCIGSRLTDAGEALSMQQWEVNDGTLNVREGTASVNGSTITVSLPVEGGEETVPVDVHILTTDYDGYALAYTCTNINSFQRLVGAFKLSRTRSLDNEAQQAIGTYMATREELHQQYFINIAQHRDCDEPSSALLIKSSILVMLVSVALHLVM